MTSTDTEKSAEFSQSLERMKESFLWAAAQGGNEQVWSTHMTYVQTLLFMCTLPCPRMY